MQVPPAPFRGACARGGSSCGADESNAGGDLGCLRSCALKHSGLLRTARCGRTCNCCSSGGGNGHHTVEPCGPCGGAKLRRQRRSVRRLRKLREPCAAGLASLDYHFVRQVPTVLPGGEKGRTQPTQGPTVQRKGVRRTARPHCSRPFPGRDVLPRAKAAGARSAHRYTPREPTRWAQQAATMTSTSRGRR